MQPEQEVLAAFEAGHTVWSGVNLTLQAFAQRLTSLGITSRNLERQGADLFLASACAEGDRKAVLYFESEIMAQVHLYVRRFAFDPHALDDVCQKVRIKLLVGGTPGIAGYRGHGPLSAWVRMIAIRIALDLTSAVESQKLSDVDLLRLSGSFDEGPELSTVKNLYRDHLRAAMEEGLRALDPRDRTLLRLYVVDGLNLDGIGALYRVHRATVARWFVAIRARVFQGVRRNLGLVGEPSPSEMRSLIGLLQDEIHLSARRLLASG